MPVRTVVKVAVVMLFLIQAASSQNIRFRGSDGWGLNSRYEHLFNINSQQDFRGVITGIDTVTPMPDMSYGIMMVVKSGFDEFAVHLGPAWYMLFQDFSLNPGEEIDIRGVRVSHAGKVFIMAIEIKSKDRILRLRDNDGIPFWCAWRRR